MKNNFIALVLLLISFALYSCKKTDSGTGITVNAGTPAVTTNDASNLTATGATIGGFITTDGGTIVTEAGVCYSTTSGVDTSDNRIPKYTASGNFSVNVAGLLSLTTYYYRAYAINEKGLVYGEEKSFFVPVAGGYTASSQVASANLIAFWPFEDSYADSKSGTVGTPSGAAVSFVTSGLKGKAVEIASPGYINSNITNTVANLTDLTITTWIKQPASLSSGPTTYFPFSLNKAGYSWEQTKFFMLFNNADNASNSYGKVCIMDQWFDQGQIWPKMLDGAWHHLAISYSGTTGALRIYVDGNLLSQSASTTLNPQSNFGDADSFTLGGPDDNAHTGNSWMNSLSGDLDEFRIFDKVLTSQEILALQALEGHGL